MTSHELQTTASTPHPAPPSSDSALPSSPTPPKAAPSTAEDVLPPNPRLAALATKRTTLTQTLEDLTAHRATLIARTTLPSGLAMPTEWSEEQRERQALSSANAVIKEHIGLLHRYNEIKDIGQGLMGMLADQRGVRCQATGKGRHEKESRGHGTEGAAPKERVVLTGIEGSSKDGGDKAAESAQSYGSTKATTSTAMSRMSPSLSGGWTKSSVAKIDTSYAVKETTYHYPLYLPCRDDQDESLVSAKPQTHRQYHAILTPRRHIASSVLASVGS
ncbi:hypothetical protein LTR03_008453 [Friedmanniomyces endolithicus]|nr:hypothetical protein LTR03_008453 [Friedmanniomyces endolithicus]